MPPILKKQVAYDDKIVAPALCLDLDGTVRRNKDLTKSFISQPTDIELMPGIEPILSRYRQAGYILFGISNQGGVAHGFKTQEDVDREIAYTVSLFEQNPFTAIYVCFCMPDGKVAPWNLRSLCRKPEYGSLALAEYEALKNGYIIDWDRSLFVGDRPEDEQCAAAAGVDFQHIDKFLHLNASM